MLQNLLRERFNLSFHRETKKKDVYALVVGKKGSKLTPYVEPSGDKSGPPKGFAPDPEGFPALPPTYVGIMLAPSATHSRLVGQGVDAKAIARSLEDATGRPLVDATGLTGKYNFRLSYQRSALRATTGQAEPGADVFGAVSEQLGLELESRNMPVEILVIDTLDRQPTEN